MQSANVIIGLCEKHLIILQVVSPCLMKYKVRIIFHVITIFNKKETEKLQNNKHEYTIQMN
jgi:hypothetical protein